MRYILRTSIAIITLITLLFSFSLTALGETNNGYYIVQKGDNLTSIAERFNVSVSDLVKWNRLKNPSTLFAGKLLITSENPDSYKPATQLDTRWVSLNFSDVDLRDVLEIVALEINRDILYVGSSLRMSIKAEKVSKAQLLDVVISTAGGMSYVNSGNLTIVGPKDKINADFKSKQLFTGIKLKYITAPELVLKSKELAIDVTIVTLEKSTNKVWVQGTPLEISRFYDLIASLDKKENFKDVDSKGIRPVFNKQITLKFITSTTFIDMIGQFKVPVTVMSNVDNPAICFVSGPGSAEDDFNAVLNLVDVKTNTQNPSNGNKTGVSQYSLKYIGVDDAIDFVAASKIEVSSIKISYYPKAVFFFGSELMRKEALRILSTIDVISENLREPVDYSNSPNGSERLNERMNLICDLSGVSPSDFTISDNVAREDGNFYFILWYKGTQSELAKVRKSIKQIDQPLNGGQ